METSFNSNKNVNTSTSKGPQNPDSSFGGNRTIVDKASELLTTDSAHKDKEGKVTRALEKQTSKIPSGFYLALALGSMVLSAVFAASSKRKDMANFVGLWAPSILMLGLYNKIVKTSGPDQH